MVHCGQCNNQSIEDEKHFLLHCNVYLLERQRILAKIDEKLDIPIFELNNDELFKVLVIVTQKLFAMLQTFYW